MCLSVSLGCWNLNSAVYTEWKQRGKVKTEILAIIFYQGNNSENASFRSFCLAAA